MTDPIDPLDIGREETLTDKAERVFPGLVIDKRRLPDSQLQKRSIPAYVGEWLLDTLVPGRGHLTSADARRVSDWSAKYVPGPNDQQVLHSIACCAERPSRY